MIELGSKVKDNVTGVVGIAVARTEWMNGCIRYGIQQKAEKDGKVSDAYWCDEEQITVLAKVKIKSIPSGGGLRQNPKPY